MANQDIPRNRRSKNLDIFVKRVAWTVGSIAFLLLFIVIGVYWHNFSNGINLSATSDRWGQFGDFVGGSLNPLFTLLSLVAILLTLILQSRELSHSTSALEEQSDSLKMQSFENTFFAMLQLNLETARTLDLEETEDEEINGRAVFRSAYKRLRDSYEHVANAPDASEDERKICSEAYKRFYGKNQRFIGAYLRTLIEIFAFIEKRCPTSEDKQDYWLLIRAQLSDFELLLLFYHGLGRPEDCSLERLNAHFVFEYLPKHQLLNRDQHETFL